MDVAQILRGRSYKVCSTTSQNFFLLGLFTLVFGISAIIHKQVVAMLRGLMIFVYMFHMVVDSLYCFNRQ